MVSSNPEDIIQQNNISTSVKDKDVLFSETFTQTIENITINNQPASNNGIDHENDVSVEIELPSTEVCHPINKETPVQTSI